MVGETVRHIRFGEGIIIKEENGKIHVKFNEGEKKFPYASFEKYVTCDNPETQKSILEKAAAIKEESEKKSTVNHIEPDNRNRIKGKGRKSNTSKDYNSWIKFEGRQNEKQKHDVVSVMDGDKTLYILNYHRKPSGVKNGATVFVAAGIQDDNGDPQQVIVGRGTLKGFDERNMVKEQWIAQYDWMHYHNWYLVLKKYEVLDAARCNGLTLNKVFRAIGGDTYPTSEGEDISMKELRQKHTQKEHLRITDKAVEYINSELDKLFRTYGVQTYCSDC